MIWNDVELFNVDHFDVRSDGAIVPYRFPKNVLNAFGGEDHHVNKYVGRMTTGCEIRFVCDFVDVILSASDEDGFVEIYRGDFFVRTERIEKGKRNRITLLKNQNIDKHDMSGLETAFNMDVWRIVFAHDFCCVICDVDAYTPIRPPKSEEVPQNKIMAYGSSITHGACSMVFSNSYIQRAAIISKSQVLCKGMGGSCHCEQEVADYIAKEDWDLAVLELAVNMLDWFDETQFENRVEYLLKTVLNTGKKVLLISHFRHFRDLVGSSAETIARNNNFVDITKMLAEKYSSENLFYVDGREIVDDYTMLTSDLIHPSQFGHSVMGERIAKIIKSII